jgi:hypothetical protein
MLPYGPEWLWRSEVEAFKQYMPLMQEIANPALQPRHWEAVFKVLGQGEAVQLHLLYSSGDCPNSILLTFIEPQGALHGEH